MTPSPKHRPVLFVALAFLISYGLGLGAPVLLGLLGRSANGLGYLPVAGPPLAALITLRLERRSPLQWYAEDLRSARVRWWWLLVPPTALLLAAAAFGMTGAPAPNMAARLIEPACAGLFASQLLLVALPEELGWRGYLTRSLLERRRPIDVALLVGVVWTLWHGPKLIELPALALVALAFSVILTALFARARGGSLLAALGHGSFNAAIMAFEPLRSPIEAICAFNIVAGLLVVLAALILWREWRWFVTPPTQTPR